MIKKIIKLYIFLILLFVNSYLYADYLIFNDGSFHRGKIESSDQKIIVFAEDGVESKQIIPVSKIQKIITKPIYLEKLTIHKADNTKIEGYCVDYEESFYVLRKFINKSEDLKILKNEILFIESKLNPVNIDIISKADGVQLKWVSPVEKIQLYKIYYKTRTDIEFRLSGETDQNEYLLTGLEGSTEYEIIIRSVTSDQFESFPGKPIGVTTLNRPPEKPGIILKKEMPDKSVIRIIWGESTDSDGRVMGYNIYKKTESGIEKIAVVKRNEFTKTITNPITRHSFIIKAFDDKNLESEGVESYPYFVNYIGIKAETGYLVPSGNLADLFNSGICGLITFSMNNNYIYGLTIGVQTGYYSFSDGKHYGSFNYQSYNVIPLSIIGGYRFVLYERFHIQPSLGLGYCFSGLEYMDGSSKKISTIEYTPVVKTGISLSYIVDCTNFGFGLYHTSIIETDTRLNSIMINISAEYFF